MKRTKTPFRIPDAINCSSSKEFTQIPNNVLRSPDISGKAKALLCLMLSNKEGWYSYLVTIQKMMKEGEEAIKSGLSELEKNGYLLRLKYRDKNTKIWRGTLWAYGDTPNEFIIRDQLKIIQQNGMEIPHLENPQLENPQVDNLELENQGLKILIYKNTKLEKDQLIYSSENGQSSNGVTITQFTKFWNLWPPSRRGSKGKALTKWETICRQKDRPSWQRIRAAILRQKKSDQWKDVEFIPLAATWLNQKRYMDDAKDLKRYDFSKNGGDEKIDDKSARRAFAEKFGGGEE